MFNAIKEESHPKAMTGRENSMGPCPRENSSPTEARESPFMIAAYSNEDNEWAFIIKMLSCRIMGMAPTYAVSVCINSPLRLMMLISVPSFRCEHPGDMAADNTSVMAHNAVEM